MNASNNVVSLQDVKLSAVKRTLMDNLSNRGGNWVSEPFLITIIMDDMPADTSAKELIDGMVQEGTLAKTFHTVTDKMQRTHHLPLYRLSPQ
jgi:hypothetical protein